MTQKRNMSGTLNHHSSVFGRSVNGIPLRVYMPPQQEAKILLISAMHGDENLASILISECMRSINPEDLKAAVILSVNPDGIMVGTRGNANGVDLNRNYPAANWKSDAVFHRSRPHDPQNIPLSPGREAGSEPETAGLIDLVKGMKPDLIVSFHGYLACIDDPLELEISLDIAKRTQMKLVPDVGYPTPGSFGSWCAEHGFAIITYEMPSLGINELREVHAPVILDLLTGKYKTAIS